MSQGLSYRILEPVWLNEQGIRDYSEDYIYPDLKIGINDQVRQFLVCDGVGGSTRGDQASKFVCSAFPVKVSDKLEQAIPGDFTPVGQERLLNKALHEVEKDMDAFAEQHPEYRGMATTLTYLNLSKNGAIVAWAGDSRVYHVRNGQVKAKTTDHSLVNELVKRGEITEEQARNHPRKNVILRAISGSTNATKVDVEIWQDIQKGDVLFMCTDGVLEAFDNDTQLAELLSSGMTLDNIRDRINALCKEHSRDNYSMYLVKVQDVEGAPIIPITPKAKPVVAGGSTTVIAREVTKSATAPVEINEDAFEDVRHDKGKHSSKVPPPPEDDRKGLPRRFQILFGLLGLLVILFGIYAYMKLVDRGPDEVEKKQKLFWEKFEGDKSTIKTLQDELDVYEGAINEISEDSVLSRTLADSLAGFRLKAIDLKESIANYRSELDTIHKLIMVKEAYISGLEPFKSDDTQKVEIDKAQKDKEALVQNIVEICIDLNRRPSICKKYAPADSKEKGNINETPDMKDRREGGSEEPGDLGGGGQTTTPESGTATAVDEEDSDNGGAPSPPDEEENAPTSSINFSDEFWREYDFHGNHIEGVIFVRKGDKYGFVNTEKTTPDGVCKVMMSPTSKHAYEDYRDFHNGFAAVKRDGKWGYVNKYAQAIFSDSSGPFPFDTIEDKFGNTCLGYGKVEVDGKKFFLKRLSNQKGELVVDKDDGSCPGEE